MGWSLSGRHTTGCVCPSFLTWGATLQTKETTTTTLQMPQCLLACIMGSEALTTVPSLPPDDNQAALKLKKEQQTKRVNKTGNLIHNQTILQM